jgi:hypothetical protein
MLNNEHAESNWYWHCWDGFFRFQGLQHWSVLKKCWMYRLYRELLTGKYSSDHLLFVVDHYGWLLSSFLFLFFLTQRCWLLDVVLVNWEGGGWGVGGSHPFLDNKFYTLSGYKASTMSHQTAPTPLWGYVFKNVQSLDNPCLDST